ncbi:hypothetical protein NA57DRAFT_57554 [Rhizodiscina lignyota]|uniref:Uncharacterized protein n=1 Tax=Rhizodiscina lignyota TaxID=1504668 RepID=A0A9P4IFL1_9PEZI|nr:hypothetical protein NA57DRAFT_57554 [Rhizodiscina lignyota]
MAEQLAVAGHAHHCPRVCVQDCSYPIRLLASAQAGPTPRAGGIVSRAPPSTYAIADRSARVAGARWMAALQFSGRGERESGRAATRPAAPTRRRKRNGHDSRHDTTHCCFQLCPADPTLSLCTLSILCAFALSAATYRDGLHVTKPPLRHHSGLQRASKTPVSPGVVDVSVQLPIAGAASALAQLKIRFIVTDSARSCVLRRSARQ